MAGLPEETLVALADVPRLLPRRRGGKTPHVATAYRWSTRGLRGIVLETIQVGGTRCTSREALARFFIRLSEEAGLTPTRPTPTQLRRRDEHDEEELARMGV
jgi:hypothetical protein